jgi:hypothetical protein
MSIVKLIIALAIIVVFAVSIDPIYSCAPVEKANLYTLLVALICVAAVFLLLRKSKPH